MTAMNMVILVGTLTKDPDFGKTGNGNDYARLSVETERFVRLRGERTRIAAAHSVICFNTFSVAYLRSGARKGDRVRVVGELAYDRAGKGEVQVSQYGGEVAAMDAAARADAPPQGEPEAAGGNAPVKASSPSGGFGSLSAPARREDPPPPRPETLTSEDPLDDQIPF